MTTIDQNLYIDFWNWTFNENCNILDADGFVFHAPDIIDGVAHNYHLVLIEYVLIGILFLLIIWFLLWLYMKRGHMKK